jgi:polyhydroxyalkanoate synthesis regulator phasin
MRMIGSTSRRTLTTASLVAATALLAVTSAHAQTALRDTIADLIKRQGGNDRIAQNAPVPKSGQTTAPAAKDLIPPAPAIAPALERKDARDGDPAFEQAQRLMKAIDAILQDTAKNRGEARKLPSKDEFILPLPWTETREDRERKIKDLMDSAMGVITDVPVVDLQKKIESLRKNIRDLDDRIVKLREKQLVAPKDGMMPGVITDTVDSLAKDIDDTTKKIELNKAEIKNQKAQVAEAMQRSGITLKPEQIDLLLDGVLSGDLVRLVAVFNSAKSIDGQLAKLMAQSGENIGAARKYFAMHAALFAMLVHAQDMALSKIDTQYLPKLEAIGTDIAAARAKTGELLKAENRTDQKRVLEANRESQRMADEAAKGYRKYLLQQREQIARARAKATHDLRIADNTYETVEASFQLRNLMKDSSQSFEALQRLEAPTFEQIFRNEELRREFENLTRKLDLPSS